MTSRTQEQTPDDRRPPKQVFQRHGPLPELPRATTYFGGRAPGNGGTLRGTSREVQVSYQYT